MGRGEEGLGSGEACGGSSGIAAANGCSLELVRHTETSTRWKNGQVYKEELSLQIPWGDSIIAVRIE